MKELTAAVRDNVNSSDANWSVFAGEDVRSAAMAMVLKMADRLADTSVVARETERARARTTGQYLWQPASLSCGYAGLAVFYGYLSAALPGQGWESCARESMSRAASASERDPLRHPGLHAGSSGPAFALLCLAEIDRRYLAAATRAYATVARQTLQWLSSRMRAHLALADERDFDVISGAAGVLAVLLALPRPAAVVEEAIQALVRDLVTFCRPSEAPGFHNWRTPPRPPDAGAPGSAEGWYNLGLAHGVLGVAVALRSAYDHGYRQDGLLAAIDNVCSWFAGRCVRDDRGVNWPEGVFAGIGDDPAPSPHGMMARPAWCYGAAGGARALWLSAAPLPRSGTASLRSSAALRQLALDAIESAARRPPSARQLDSPILCHGLGGLLMVCLRFAQDAQSDALRMAIPQLTTEIVESCHPDRPFFVRDLRAHGVEVEDPGLLTGTVGVGLALLAAVSPIEPRWDRAMLLST